MLFLKHRQFSSELLSMPRIGTKTSLCLFLDVDASSMFAELDNKCDDDSGPTLLMAK